MACCSRCGQKVKEEGRLCGRCRRALKAEAKGSDRAAAPESVLAERQQGEEASGTIYETDPGKIFAAMGLDALHTLEEASIELWGRSFAEVALKGYVPPRLEVYCLTADRTPELVVDSAMLIKAGLRGMAARIMFAIRMNRLFSRARSYGKSLTEYFIDEPHLWAALALIVTTHGVGNTLEQKGAVTVSRHEWMRLLNRFLNLFKEGELEGKKREQIAQVAETCFRVGAKELYGSPSDTDVLTFCVRWK